MAISLKEAADPDAQFDLSTCCLEDLRNSSRFCGICAMCSSDPYTHAYGSKRYRAIIDENGYFLNDCKNYQTVLRKYKLITQAQLGVKDYVSPIEYDGLDAQIGCVKIELDDHDMSYK